MYFFDPRYFIFMLPPLILAMWAQWRLRSIFGQYSQVRSMQGLTGARAARMLLDSQGLSHVPVEEMPGAQPLDNHYDPRDRTLRLSPEIYRSGSVAAVGVAAHEAGHAVQHAQGYAPLQLRSTLVPAVNIGSNIGVWLIILGIMLAAFTHFTGAVWMVWLGVALFALAAVFALVTLPVELNASSRAMTLLQSTGLIDRTEYKQARQVLNAAAMTYVAGLAAAVSQLLYYVMLASGMSRRQD
jgi:Zn-dependent membrane protease YugP